jgi:hypothetical protein
VIHCVCLFCGLSVVCRTYFVRLQNLLDVADCNRFAVSHVIASQLDAIMRLDILKVFAFKMVDFK